MPQQPPRRPASKPALPGARGSGQPSGARRDSDPPGAESDRPTVNPPFDLEAYARASATAPAAPEPGRGASARRQAPTEMPTVRPPSPDGSIPSMRAEQITLTNEIELERARAKSAGGPTASAPSAPDASQRRTEAPRFNTPGALSMANARVPSAPNMPGALSASNARAPSAPGMPSALSMANARVPSAPNMPSALSMANAHAPSAPSLPVARSPSPSSIEAAVLGAIGSAGPEIVERTIDDPIAEMRERFSLGDYTGALEIAELMLAEDPGDDAAAQCAESCRGVLESMYAARLGSLDRVPSVLVQRTQLRWLSIDHRAGFVLSLVDGTSTLEMILDVCGMPRLDAIRILHELVQQKILALKG
jgi:hypothetical protein